MSSITEQFSAVTKSQLETQFQIFNSLAHTVVDSAEKLIALNLTASKASVEQSSAAAKKLLEVKDAKELFTASRDTPTGLDSVLAYSRELFAIASGIQAELIKNTRSVPLPQLLAPALEAVKAAAPVAEALKAATPAVVPAAEPAAVAATPVVAPVAATPKVAAVAAAAAAVEPAVAAPTVAPLVDTAPPATTIEAAVSAVVHADQTPALVETPAPVTQLASAPLAASVAPTAPQAIKPALKPVTETAAAAAVAKPAFPAAKPIALVADTKTSKLKVIAPKARTADASAGKHKK